MSQDDDPLIIDIPPLKCVEDGTVDNGPGALAEQLSTETGKAAAGDLLDYLSQEGLEMEDLAEGVSFQKNHPRSIKSRNRKRVDAAVSYIVDADRPTIAKIAAKFDIAIRTAESWSAEDSWVEQREKYLGFVAEKLRQTADATLTDELKESLGQMRRLRDRTFKLLTGKGNEVIDDGVDLMPMPKSYEGVLRSYIDLDRRLEQVVDKAIDRIAGQRKTESGAAAADTLPEGLTEEEVDAMGQALLDQRQEGSLVRIEPEAAEPVLDVAAAAAEAPPPPVDTEIEDVI